jgi:23S rRNA G2445 N2-methylase RlmL
VVDKMLEMAKWGRATSSTTWDAATAASSSSRPSFSAPRGVGIDLSPERIAEANANLKATGMQDRVKFIQADLFKSDFSEATVVTLYLGAQVNAALRPHCGGS